MQPSESVSSERPPTSPFGLDPRPHVPHPNPGKAIVHLNVSRDSERTCQEVGCDRKAAGWIVNRGTPGTRPAWVGCYCRRHNQIRQRGNLMDGYCRCGWWPTEGTWRGDPYETCDSCRKRAREHKRRQRAQWDREGRDEGDILVDAAFQRNRVRLSKGKSPVDSPSLSRKRAGPKRSPRQVAQAIERDFAEFVAAKRKERQGTSAGDSSPDVAGDQAMALPDVPDAEFEEAIKSVPPRIADALTWRREAEALWDRKERLERKLEAVKEVLKGECDWLTPYQVDSMLTASSMAEAERLLRMWAEGRERAECGLRPIWAVEHEAKRQGRDVDEAVAEERDLLRQCQDNRRRFGDR